MTRLILLLDRAALGTYTDIGNSHFLSLLPDYGTKALTQDIVKRQYEWICEITGLCHGMGPMELRHSFAIHGNRDTG